MNYLNTWMTSVKNRYMVILLKTNTKKNYKNMSIKIGGKKCDERSTKVAEYGTPRACPSP